MALWAFHNNPGIGGFGESNPILFGGSTVRAETKRNGAREKKKRRGERISNRIPSTSSDKSNRKNTASSADLICQVVKELVDNAVDACRTPSSDGDTFRQEKQKKRIRVEIQPFHNTKTIDDKSLTLSLSKRNHSEILKLTVTDNGCGMENIQNCVNAFQTSKGGENRRNENIGDSSVADVSSGRYGIGLTLCLLHAQRCIPNSVACISSTTPKSKHLTKVYFEVDKHEDCVKCVQEEKVDLSTPATESGTCVSLLIPGAIAAESAWPKLKEYFTRFRLCTKLHFELEVVAPTLSNRPIFIRSSKSSSDEIESRQSTNQRESNGGASRDVPKSDEWKDLLDDNGSKEESDSAGTKSLVGEAKKLADCCDNERSEFANAVHSFWPNCNVKINNVAKSIRPIRYLNEDGLSNREDGEESKAELEVSIAVCPNFQNIQNRDCTVDSSVTSSNDALLGDDQAARLQLIRIVNDVPIIENAEAHSCGLVHSIADKKLWGSFGLDIERSVTTSQSTKASAPSFRLRDSNLVAPFINKNANHRLLEESNDGEDLDQRSNEKNRKRRRSRVHASNELCPANLRIGVILVVVHVRANPFALPLPTLSKGRLPLNHEPIEEALLLGLRNCIMSLQSRNNGLFLSTSQLRAVERDVRYIPAIASAASRIICRSRNPCLRNKCVALIPKESPRPDRSLEESLSDTEEEDEESKLEISELSNALEDRLRLAIKVRNESMSRKRSRRENNKSSNAAAEDFQDFDSEQEEDEASRCLVSEKSCSPSLPLSQEESRIESVSTLSFGSKSSNSSCDQRFSEFPYQPSKFPPTEFVLVHCPTQSTQDEDAFDDFFEQQ